MTTHPAGRWDPPPPTPHHHDDPFPIGTEVEIRDYDGSRFGSYTVVRTYWPKPVVELSGPAGLVREHHDRMVRLG